MRHLPLIPRMASTAVGAVLIWSVSTTFATAQECENQGAEDADFGECRETEEINSTDGDIGFHWLSDADELNSTRIDDPNGTKVFENGAFGPLREQKLTETFGESSEPLCWDSPELEEGEDPVTLTDFREIWEPGTYIISARGDQGEKLAGEAELTYYLPAAPTDLDFDENTGVITWKAGDDLGNCAPLSGGSSLAQLVSDGILDALPKDVAVRSWEVVLEPDVDDTDPNAGLKFSTRIAGPLAAPGVGTMYSVTVPAEYLASLNDDTPVKIEVGAIGGNFTVSNDEVTGDDDNATFTEADGFCVKEDEGCDD